MSKAVFEGIIPSDASTDTNALFAALLPFRWREIEFPVVETEIELRQDLAIHKFADRDGAHIEGTGRAPLQITARIPFLNGLLQGAQEHWQRPLYPFVWRKFFAACADRSSGPLQHPELGPLTVKCEHARTKWASTVRSGTYVDVTWLESDDNNVELNEDLANPSPLASVQAAAADLDQQLSFKDPVVTPSLPTFPTTFSDLAFAVRGAIDQFTVLQKQTAGRIDNIIYQANALENSLNMATNANSLNWPMFQSAERAKSAAYDLKASLLVKGKPIGLYTVAKNSTLAQVTATLGAQLNDMIILNPALLSTPLVPQGTVVRHYLAAA